MLERERDFFFLRCVERGTVWGSSRLKKKYSVPTAVDCVDDWKSFVAPEDVSTLEAANSRALKLGGRHSFGIKLLSRDNGKEEYDAVCEAFHCTGCGAILTILVPVSEPS